MGGLPFLLLLLAAALAEEKQKITKSELLDQPRFSCFISNYRRMSADCTSNQKVCYYTRRMPRFISDFRPNDLIGRGCDVPRNKEADSCQEYTKGLDTFVRCECATSDCNSHYWHGFAVAALHHRKVLQDERKQARQSGGGEGEEKYADWFMRCFNLMLLLFLYYFIDNLIKRYRFQKRAVLMRAVLVARGTEQAENLHWNFDENPEISTRTQVTIHNFKTSPLKILDGFIRYRSLGSLPAVDINQLRATWLLGKQDLHRWPEWYRKAYEKDKIDRIATRYNGEALDAARIAVEGFFVDNMVAEEMLLVKREKKAARKKKTTIVAPTDQVGVKSDPEESSSRNTTNAQEPIHDPGFVL